MLSLRGTLLSGRAIAYDKPPANPGREAHRGREACRGGFETRPYKINLTHRECRTRAGMRSVPTITTSAGVSIRLASSTHRNDLVALVMHHDVVVRAQCIMILGREGAIVFFDQSLVRRFEVLKCRAHRVRFGCARLLDTQREEVHGVIAVRGPNRREDVLRSFDLRIFFLEACKHAFADRAELAEEAVGLNEVGIARRRPRKLGEAFR